MSMRLYTVFNNYLLKELNGLAARIGDYCVTCPTYADDIALITLHKPTMQMLLDIAYEHSVRWGYTFNPSKSVLVVMGKDLSPSLNLNLGVHPLIQGTKEKHLGVPLVSNTKH